MEDKSFICKQLLQCRDCRVHNGTSELTTRLFKLRFEHDWLFKKKKQPWREFYKILMENGFPEEMTINHVRKKWSYTYDTYKIAKRTKNKQWKYYKMFEKHYGKSKSLYDKYGSWNDEWRLKLITCISETKEHKLDFQTMWRTIERAMRCQELPSDCCVHDMKGLWQHLRSTFNRKHRLKIKKELGQSDWPLYDAMLSYFQRHELDYLLKLENEDFLVHLRAPIKYSKKKGVVNDRNDNETEEFQWSKDITETFIQIRLQNNWLFRERKWSWNELLAVMRSEYGFPENLTSREISRKWAATYGDYQKAKATNNKTWIYYNLFELYIGEGSLSLNPLVGWQEEWVFNLISARSDSEHLFKFSYKDQTEGWREVEKRLRDIGLPLDHSLLDLPEIWTHLLKTYRWKHKFASKGILNEHWPYYDAISQYVAKQDAPVKRQRPDVLEYDDVADDVADGVLDDDFEDDMKLFDLKQSNGRTKKQYIRRARRKRQRTEVREYDDVTDDVVDEDFEDDMKLFDLKQRLKEKSSAEHLCRSCRSSDGCIDIFESSDDGDLAHKLRIIGGIEVDKSDNLPTTICFNCFRDLDTAYKFRQKCQEIDKLLRNQGPQIKVEVLDKLEEDPARESHDTKKEFVPEDMDDVDHFDDLSLEPPPKKNNVVKKEKVMRKRKKGPRKLRYDYWKICEVCGKHTRNLVSHLDMHSSGKAYSCNMCDKTFKFKSGLVVHKAVHDPTPKKTCPVCGKTFHIMAQYRRHFVYHANERRYECETCGKRFNTLDILRVHNRMHTGERPFTCQECGKTFRTAGCVSRHRRIVHRGIKVQ